MNQLDQLSAKDPHELLHATIKYDELIQVILQNKILVEKGYWNVLICNSDEIGFRLYNVRRIHLIKTCIIDEDELRKAVLNLLIK